jgi:colanic acid/amylovoran biosynthesis glycosyltransferase
LKKTRILYLTNSLNSNSETFIQNTIKQISTLENIIINVFTTQNSKNYLFKNNVFLKIYLILARIKFDSARFFLLDNLFNLEYDSVYIDFGTNAFEFGNYFESRKKQIIVHFHGYDISKSLKSKNYLDWIINFTKVNKIIVPSIYNANRLEMLGCNIDNISVIPYAFYSEISSKPKETNHYDLIFVGRFVSKKDPRILIHTLKAVAKVFPDVKLCMVGSGYLMAEVIKLIERFELTKNVILKGSLLQSEVYDLLNNSKVYVQHCVTAFDGDQEGFPNSILEASSFGLPVVSTIHAGIPEIVLDGKSGFLVQEYDYKTMSNKIIQLLSDEALRIKMGDFGKKYIQEKCDPQKRISAIEKILNV